MVHGGNSRSVQRRVAVEHNPDTDTERATTQNHNMAGAAVQDHPLNRKQVPVIPIHAKVNSKNLQFLNFTVYLEEGRSLDQTLFTVLSYVIIYVSNTVCSQ